MKCYMAYDLSFPYLSIIVITPLTVDLELIISGVNVQLLKKDLTAIL